MTTLASSNLSAGTYTPGQRYAGESDIITNSVTIAQAAGSIADGTVLGRIDASGKLVPCNSGAADGSQKPVAILCEAVNATAGDVVAPVYVAGEFNLDFCVFHASFDTEAKKLAAFAPGAAIVIRKLGYSG